MRVENSRMDEHELLAIYLPELFLEEKLSNEYVVKIYEKAMSYSYTFASYFNATSLFHTKCDNTGESKLESKAMQKSEGVDLPEDEMTNKRRPNDSKEEKGQIMASKGDQSERWNTGNNEKALIERNNNKASALIERN